VKIQEAENQIITHLEVFADRPDDSKLLIPSIQVHQRKFGRVPRAVAADAGFYSWENEKAAQAMGVKWVSVPNRNTQSAERKRFYRQRFRRGQRWRTGCEGRISVLKRRHGMRRCLYRGFRWHAALGRAQCDRRQCDTNRPMSRHAENMTRRTRSVLLVEPSETKVATRSDSHLVVHDRICSGIAFLRRKVARILHAYSLAAQGECELTT
jgi:Transposase DDE domain